MDISPKQNSPNSEIKTTILNNVGLRDKRIKYGKLGRKVKSTEDNKFTNKIIVFKQRKRISDQRNLH